MKKILSFLGALFLVLIILFAFMHFNMKRYFYSGYGYHSGPMIMRGYHGGHMMGYGRYGEELDRYYKLTSEEGKKYLKAREETLKIYSEYGVDISRKQLDLEAELLKENPDWEKVQSLSDEIALLESKIKTETLKINHENFKE